MVKATASSVLPLPAVAQDGAQTPANELVQRREGPDVTMLEVVEPALSDGVDRPDDLRQRVAMATSGPVPNGVFELPQALRARPARQSFLPAGTLEVVTQEVEPSPRLAHIHQSGLFRMERQSGRTRPRSQLGQRTFGLFLRAAQDDQVVRVPYQVQPQLRQPMVQRVEVDVSQQWADNPALGGAFLRLGHLTTLHHAPMQEHFDQPQDPSVRHPFPYSRQQRRPRDGVET